jgi:hypothetical protein
MHTPSSTAERYRAEARLRPIGGFGITRRPLTRPATTSDGGRTYDELYEEAKRRNIKGRSKMSKTELERALGR